MAASNKPNGSILGVIGTVAGAIVAAAPAVDAVIKQSRTSEAGDPHIDLPALYDKGFPIKLNDAVELLNGFGLKVITSELSLSDAAVKYKDCFAFQVVGSNPKQKQRVKTGSTVILRYITQEVIDESQRIFTEAENNKENAKLEKAAKREHQKEQAKKAVAITADAAKAKIDKIFKRHKNEEENEELGEF